MLNPNPTTVDRSHPPLFMWFDTTCISNGLMFIMVRVAFGMASVPPTLNTLNRDSSPVPQLGMGITLTLDEIKTVFVKQPQLLMLGMVLQYSGEAEG